MGGVLRPHQALWGLLGQDGGGEVEDPDSGDLRDLQGAGLEAGRPPGSEDEGPGPIQASSNNNYKATRTSGAIAPSF